MSKSDKNNDFGIFKANKDFYDLVNRDSFDFDPSFLGVNDDTEELTFTSFDLGNACVEVEDRLNFTVDEVTEVLELTKDITKILSNDDVCCFIDDDKKMELTKNLDILTNTKQITLELAELTKKVCEIKKDNNIDDLNDNMELSKIPRRELLTLMDLVENASRSVNERQTINLEEYRKKSLKVSREEFDKLPSKNGQKVKKVLRVDRVIWTIIFLISFLGFIYLVGNLVVWEYERYKTNLKIDNLNENVTLNEVVSMGTTIDIKEDDGTYVEDTVLYQQKKDDYWYYVSKSMLSVDFEELKKINNDIAGWIVVNGTNINYPYVQSSDNSYYLKHSIDKSYNQAGWVFLDYRNDKDKFGKNTILYAHGRLDKTMFGSLSTALNPLWYNNVNNHIIKISTDTSNSLWKVFSVYVIKAESYYIKVNFKSDDDFGDFVNTLKERSVHDFGVDVDSSDQVLTLSTCYDMNDNRMVLHAKLIKLEEK